MINLIKKVLPLFFVCILQCSCNNSTKEIKFSSKQIYPESITVSYFLGEGHIKAYKLFRNGFISIDEYNETLNQRENTYFNLLLYTDLLSYDLYVYNNGIFKMAHEDSKGKVNEMILKSAVEKQIDLFAATENNIFGVMILIRPQVDNEENFIEGKKIYIPHLFERSSKETFTYKVTE